MFLVFESRICIRETRLKIKDEMWQKWLLTFPPLLHPTKHSDVCLMPVVTLKFRSASGRVREGNVHIHSSAGTTVIRKDFSRDLDLQGQEERIDIAAVGDERISQSNSRTVNFWISPLNGKRDFSHRSSRLGSCNYKRTQHHPHVVIVIRSPDPHRVCTPRWSTRH